MFIIVNEIQYQNIYDEEINKICIMLFYAWSLIFISE